MTTSFAIGDIRLERIDEMSGPAIDARYLLPGLPDDAIERNLEWLAPTFLEADTEKLVLSLHGWVVRTGRHTVLVEACGGNHKNRPEYPRVHELETPWLDRLRAAGVSPEEIDYVFCSHLHVDHIGWFTAMDSGAWTPTFPNAKYLIHRREYDNWNPETRTLPPLALQGSCWDDSVAPVVAAGQAVMVEDGHEIDDALTIEASFGHTLGHCSVRATSRNETGIFCGDIMHSPLEMAYPDVNTYACEDQDAARATRRKLLEEAAEFGHALMPAHFPDPYSICRVARDGDAFAVRRFEDG
ncbi:MAG: MBL fold metallo-hydrolase [Alphaproteobacteria bacterium]|nr:MBL fold metallo-hydrolase [Alphaproteobacteria bacterium]